MNRREFMGQIAVAGAAVPAVSMSAPPEVAAQVSSAATQEESTVFVYDPVYLKHTTGQGHPERPDRLSAVVTALNKSGLDKKMVRLKPPLAKDQDILRCHKAAYLKQVKQDFKDGADRP